jgi:uncharacterized protein (DUF934 family)
MTDTTAPETRLWTPQGFRDDEWRHGEDAEALASNNKVILPLQAVLGLDGQTRANAKARLGVLLMPGDPVEQIAGLLEDLSLVALSFPAFSDGRSFSKADILRRRYGFAGSVRAVGQVLVDQLPHMLRVGFDEFEISHPVLLKRLEEGRLDGLPMHYQPSASAAKSGEKYSWRRKPAAG